MSFFIAKVSAVGRESCRFLETRKVRLGGPDGPIARHVLAQIHPEWSLEGSPLAEALRPSDWEAGQVWLVWQAPGEPPCRVSHMTGVSSEFTTDLMVQLELLEPGPEDTFRPLGKLTGEALGLQGGRLTPKAKWTWTAPKMAIGSTTLG